MTRIFLNYRRTDSEGYVGRLFDHLSQHFVRENIFMDIDSLPPGMDFTVELEKAIAACDVLLAVIGPQWLTVTDDSGERRLHQWNDFVRIEIASALKQDKLVIPVLVGRARMPSPAELPEDLHPLARRHAVELGHQHFARDVERLANAIRSTIVAKPRADSETIRRKEQAIKTVRMDLMSDTRSPLYAFRTQNDYLPVVGEGNPDANIIFIGETPGKAEAEIGRPFCGPSGEVLDELLDGITMKREDVFLTNTLLDRTPDNREPLPEELDFYAVYLDRLLDIIQPTVFATLGRFAMEYMLKKLNMPEKRGKISALHGRLLKAELPYGEVHVLPLFHPAFVLYSPNKKDMLRKDFEKLRLFM